MAGTFTVMGMSAGENAGQRVFGPITVVGKTIIGETLVVVLTAGDNTFVVPGESVAVMIVPPVGSAVNLKVRTSANSTDAGLPINPGPAPFLLTFPTAIPASLIINAESTTKPVSIAFI